MATHFQYDCPHCDSRKSSFTVSAQYLRREALGDSYLFAVCGVCDRPVTFWYVDYARVSGRMAIPLGQQISNVEFPGSQFTIITSWPENCGDVPERLPENVSRYYEQGIHNEGSGNWDAAGAMFRKALDVATKILDPDNSSKSLFMRINEMEKSGRLTAEISNWAHEIRIEGNEAVHGDDPETPEDVAAIHEFCRGFLIYTFTLPRLVASRKSKS